MAIDFEPANVVRILYNVPIDNTYRNTIDFASAGTSKLQRLSAQQTYFMSKTKYMFTDFSYQRMERRIRVPVNIEQLYDCNYVMYQNKNFTNKWFYAFITDLEYANPEMTWVTIETDVYQTWLTEMEWKQSFILREHVEDDTPGNHLVPEDLDTGEFVYFNAVSGYEPMNDLLVIVASTSTEYENVTGSVYNKIYSGCQFTAWDITTENGLNDLNGFLSALDHAGKGDAISSMFLYPKIFVEYASDSHIVRTGDTVVERPVQVQMPLTNAFEGYVPKNNKLYTWPYCFLKVTNNAGSDALIEFEYCQNPFSVPGNVTVPFNIISALSTNPTAVCIPRGYKNNYQDGVLYRNNYDCMVTLSNFPQCQWSYGSYENWFAQNSAMINLQNARIERNMQIDVAQGSANTAINALSGIASLITGGGIGGLQGAANQGVETYQAYKNAQDDIKSNMIAVYQHSIQPPQTRGNTGGLGSNVALGIQNFYFYLMGVQKEYAKRIDDYFSTYGYKVNEFKVPNLTSRPHWNYIQTVDANIEGSFPDLHIEKLKSIFNKGITIWHNGNDVNDYSLDNGVSKT